MTEHQKGCTHEKIYWEDDMYEEDNQKFQDGTCSKCEMIIRRYWQISAIYEVHDDSLDLIPI